MKGKRKMLGGRFELPRDFSRQPLKLVRLPIPPSQRGKGRILAVLII